MNKLIVIPLLWTAGSAFAAIEDAKDVKPTKITCAEFITLDESVQPRVVYVLEGVSQKGKPEEMIVALDEISKPVAWVTEECRKSPKATVWQKVENYVKSVTKKL